MANIYSLDGKVVGKIELPPQFSEEYRPDLIKKAVVVLQTRKLQPKGVNALAGKRKVAFLRKKRRAYKGTYGRGQSRTPRKILSRMGRRFYWIGAFAPQTVGGRSAHPPLPEKNIVKDIPAKERRKALRSAIAATAIKEIVEKRGHKFKDVPIVVVDDFEKIDKTKEVQKVLESLGLKEELERTKKKTIRPGKGKRRGRKYKKKKGPLLVVSGRCKLLYSGRNIPGIEVSTVKNLNVELLAPGTHAGRLTIWTKSALEKMKEENLFM